MKESSMGLKISESYYNKLWCSGRKAPFLTAREILKSNPKISKDYMKGFNSLIDMKYLGGR